MKRGLLIMFLVSTVAIVLFLSWSPIAAKGCEYDSQCKGNRVCENGRCVSSSEDKEDDPDSQQFPEGNKPQ